MNTEKNGMSLCMRMLKTISNSSDEINRRLIEDARLWLERGEIFGEEGEGFQRLNIATPRTNLTECLERIREHVLKIS